MSINIFNVRREKVRAPSQKMGGKRRVFQLTEFERIYLNSTLQYRNRLTRTLRFYWSNESFGPQWGDSLFILNKKIMLNKLRRLKTLKMYNIITAYLNNRNDGEFNALFKKLSKIHTNFIKINLSDWYSKEIEWRLENVWLLHEINPEISPHKKIFRLTSWK